MRLKDVDLNLLVMFHQLFKDRRVSAAAASLGLSQPAVSSALNRLRRMSGDELFVRTGRGMLPTPFAKELEKQTADALRTIQNALNEKGAFEPLTSARTFALSMADLGEVHLLPKLMQTLARTAPQVTIASVRHAASNLPQDMATGKVDLAIGTLPGLKTNFFQRRLFALRYVCMFRKGHPLDRPRITASDFAAAEHVVVAAAGTGHSKVNEVLDRAGARAAVHLRVPHFVAVADILHTTNLVATVPEQFAVRGAAFFGLRYVTHPIKLPSIQINVYWHARFHRDPTNQWLRTVLFDMFAE